MPTCERRFHLGLLVKEKQEEASRMEELQKKSSKKTGKGAKQTTISGEALKNKMKSGTIKQ